MHTSLAKAKILKKNQEGAYLLVTIIMLPFLIGLLALSVDVGMMILSKNNLQRLTDFSALAAAMKLHPEAQSSPQERLTLVQTYLNTHVRAGNTIENVAVTEGNWDASLHHFSEGASPVNALNVVVHAKDELYFSKIFNLSSYSYSSGAIATISDSRPLAITVLFDASSHMSLASQFNGINFDSEGYQFTLPSELITERLTLINNQLMSLDGPVAPPPYGGLTLSNQELLGSTEYIKEELGLTNVDYPYSGNGGSWEDYIDYIQSGISLSYRNLYSMLTLINYWQEVTYTALQVPSLQYVSEYPLVLIKENISYFLNQLHEQDEVLGLIRQNTSSINVSPATNETLSGVIARLQAGQTVEDEATAFDTLLAPALQNQFNLLFDQESARYKRVVLVICTFAKCAGTTDLDTKAGLIKQWIKQDKINLYYLSIGIASDTPEYSALKSSFGGSASFLGDSASLSELNIDDITLKQAIDRLREAMSRGMPHLVSSSS